MRKSVALAVAAGMLLVSASQASSDTIKSTTSMVHGDYDHWSVFAKPGSGSKTKPFALQSKFEPKRGLKSHSQLRTSRRNDWRRTIGGAALSMRGINCWVSVYPHPPKTSWRPETHWEGTSTHLPKCPPVSPVPLPAALPLFAGGLVLMGWMARRRRGQSLDV
jgi:hypothetical protein